MLLAGICLASLDSGTLGRAAHRLCCSSQLVRLALRYNRLGDVEFAQKWTGQVGRMPRLGRFREGGQLDRLRLELADGLRIASRHVEPETRTLQKGGLKFQATVKDRQAGAHAAPARGHYLSRAAAHDSTVSSISCSAHSMESLLLVG